MNSKTLMKFSEKIWISFFNYSIPLIIYFIFSDFKIQMILIYILYIFFIVFYLTLIILNNEKKYFKINEKILRKIVINVSVITVLFIIVLPIGKINNKLYDYKIGTKNIELVNSDREDIFSENNYRRIKLRMFYPINSKGKKYDDLFIDKDIISNLESLSKLDKVVINYLKNQKISAYIGKELYSDLKDLPVVIISHKTNYLSEYYIGISEKLASLGYFVVAINHTSMSKFVEVNNEVIYFNDMDFTVDDFQLNYENDISDVINLIEKINKEDYNYSLNTDEISIIGHGISGGAAINIAFEDNRVNNVIAIDPILNNIKKYYDNSYNLLVFKSSEFNNEKQVILDDIVKNNNAVISIYEEKNSMSKDYTSLSLISPFSNILKITKKANIKKIHEIEIEFLKKD